MTSYFMSVRPTFDRKWSYSVPQVTEKERRNRKENRIGIEGHQRRESRGRHTQEYTKKGRRKNDKRERER